MGWLPSGWLHGFTDFQRNLRFGSKLADMVEDMRKKAEFLSVLSFMFCRLKSARERIAGFQCHAIQNRSK